jgi:transcriptional regulator with XRE-family HTH domain
MAVSEYDRALVARTRELREALGWTQQKMADALNIPGARYRTYESRGPLPYDLVKPFAELTGASIEFVVTGHHGGRPPSAGPRKKLTGRERDEFMRIVTKLLG